LGETENFSEVESTRSQGKQLQPAVSQSVSDPVLYTIYGLALAVAVSIWLIAIRAPLWLDETGTYWQIHAGFSQIWARHLQSLSFPAYAYILWLSTKILGTSEIALRTPSILAMLGAVYLLYRIARELFERDTALIAAIIFSLNPIVVFAAIDVRPYAFGVLAVNAAILILLRLRHNNSNWMAALFGFSAACIIYFHFLFGVILPALLICFFIIKRDNRKVLWRQFGIAIATFAVAFLPVLPGLLFLTHTAKTYVYEEAPTLMVLAGTFAPVRLLIDQMWLSFVLYAVIFVTFVVVAFVTRRRSQLDKIEFWQVLVYTALAFIPVLILYGVSVGTSLHTFASRHRLETVPGIALCWAMVFTLLRSRVARLIFCVVFVAAAAYISYSSPAARSHQHTWKYALEAAEKNASVDNAPVLVCSDFVETNFAINPVKSANDNIFFAPLSYYKLTVPVVPLPLALNDEAMQLSTEFLADVTTKHQRFLAVANGRSYKTLDWVAKTASATYTVRQLGVYDGVEVLEFVPQTPVAASR
jgi:hypothetical protein